jgi:hypothetical protein
MSNATIFICTNAKQIVGALVAAHALRRFAARPDAFAVEILRLENYGYFAAHEGRLFLRNGAKRPWTNDDLQSFTPLRFMPPQLMGYAGRALVIDPDVFAAGSVNELLDRDMQGKSILARPRPGHNNDPNYIATSVMLLDCAKLQHWQMPRDFEALFAFQRDYGRWITLADEPRDTIGALEPVWNDFDRLTAETRLLHTTKRRTQPWKTGLPIDYTNRVPIPMLGKLLDNNGFRLPLRYKRHPDPHQEAFFFALLQECLDQGSISTALLEAEMAHNHVRHDAFAVLRRTAPLDTVMREMTLGVAS